VELTTNMNKIKKYYAKYKETCYKDEIIIYAKNRKEAQELIDNHSSEIDYDYAEESNEVFDWPPKEKFDRDNTLIIRKNKIIQPKLKTVRTPRGELLDNIPLSEQVEYDLISLSKNEMKKLGKKISNLIKDEIKILKIKYKENEIKRIKKNF
jgi:hypothetical protein